MAGAGHFLIMLVLAATPELPARGSAPADARPQAKAAAKSAPKPIATAVDLGSKWGIVTSVRRSPEHNRAVGGAPNSFHLAGRAIDIARRPGVRHAEIEAAYRKAGFVLIESLDEGDHSHFAFGLIGTDDRRASTQRTQLALVAAEPKCVADPNATLKGRRRPDRFDGCPDSPEPAPRLRPLQTAP